MEEPANLECGGVSRVAEGPCDVLQCSLTPMHELRWGLTTTLKGGSCEIQ